MKQQPVLLWALRAVLLVAVLGIATNLTFTSDRLFEIATPTPLTAYLFPLALFVGLLAIGLAAIGFDVYWRQKDIKTLSALYFGLLLGLLFGYLFSSALISVIRPASFTDNRIWPFEAPIKLLVTLIFCYVCVSTLVQTKDDFRFIIPYIEFSKQVKGGRPLVLDTSVIIDGRIADICDTRVIDNKLIVPRFVLHELQSIADSSDKLKRNRGRRGMDMLKRMQGNPKVDLEIHEANLVELRDVQEVDQRLVLLAKALGGRVVTNDYNLNKVAQLQGVEVINLNELANAMKSVALPGEALHVKLIKPGDQMGQGVGYLDDGTMVVAEQGRNFIGQDVNITVTSILQTPAGRMIFGRVEGKTPPPATNMDKNRPLA